MKRFLFFWTLLSLLCFSLFSTSCKKDEDDAPYDIPVEVTNHSNEVVYLYAYGEYQDVIYANRVNNYVFTTKNGNSVKFEVKNKDGQVLHSKTVGKGESYVAEVDSGKPDSRNSESDSNDSGTTVTNNNWSFPVEISNTSLYPIRLYIDGEEKKIIESNYRFTSTYNVTNKSRVSIMIKTSDGKILDSKNLTQGGSYINTITDPTFTINKIVLTKWRANNLFDRPDPWFRILNGDDFIGRTDYYSDCNDGDYLIWSNLNIKVKDVYSNVTYQLYDYNLGYSTFGSSFISGIIDKNFISEWGNNSFECSTSEMSFTVYGTWN